MKKTLKVLTLITSIMFINNCLFAEDLPDARALFNVAKGIKAEPFKNIKKVKNSKGKRTIKFDPHKFQRDNSFCGEVDPTGNYYLGFRYGEIGEYDFDYNFQEVYVFDLEDRTKLNTGLVIKSGADDDGVYRGCAFYNGGVAMLIKREGAGYLYEYNYHGNARLAATINDSKAAGYGLASYDKANGKVNLGFVYIYDIKTGILAENESEPDTRVFWDKRDKIEVKGIRGLTGSFKALNDRDCGFVAKDSKSCDKYYIFIYNSQKRKLYWTYTDLDVKNISLCGLNKKNNVLNIRAEYNRGEVRNILLQLKEGIFSTEIPKFVEYEKTRSVLGHLATDIAFVDNGMYVYGYGSYGTGIFVQHLDSYGNSVNESVLKVDAYRGVSDYMYPTEDGYLVGSRDLGWESDTGAKSYLTNISKCGDKVWQITLANNPQSPVTAIKAMEDNNFMLVTGAFVKGFEIKKINRMGDIIFSKKISDYTAYKGGALKQAANGYALPVSMTDDEGKQLYNIMEIDALGNTRLAAGSGVTCEAQLMDIVKTPGGYLYCFAANGPRFEERGDKTYTYNVDANGTILYSNIYNNFFAYSACCDEAGNVILAGSRMMEDTGADTSIIKTDINGKNIWEKGFRICGGQCPRGLITKDGFYYFIMQEQVVKMDKDGVVIW